MALKRPLDLKLLHILKKKYVEYVTVDVKIIIL